MHQMRTLSNILHVLQVIAVLFSHAHQSLADCSSGAPKAGLGKRGSRESWPAHLGDSLTHHPPSASMLRCCCSSCLFRQPASTAAGRKRCSSICCRHSTRQLPDGADQCCGAAGSCGAVAAASACRPRHQPHNRTLDRCQKSPLPLLVI